MTVVIIAAAVILAIPAYATLRWAPPPRLTPLVAARHLLACCAVFLLSLVARQDPLAGDFWHWTLLASVLFLVMLVLVLWDEVRQA